MNAPTNIFIDLQNIVLVFLTLFAGMVLGLGVCSKTRKFQEKVNYSDRRAHMQNLTNRSDRVASEIEASEGRDLIRERPGVYRSKRQSRRNHDDNDHRVSQSKANEYQHEDQSEQNDRSNHHDRGSQIDRDGRHNRSDKHDRSASKRPKKTGGVDGFHQRSQIYEVTESKQLQPLNETIKLGKSDRAPKNKTHAVVEYKSTRSKQLSARNDDTKRRVQNAFSQKRSSQLPKRGSRNNSHSKRTKIITFEKNSKSHRSTSTKIPLDVTQDDSSSSVSDPEAFPFKDKSQANYKVAYKYCSPRSKTSNFQNDQTQTVHEDITQESISEPQSRVIRSRIRQITDLSASSGIQCAESQKNDHLNRVRIGVTKENTKSKNNFDLFKKTRRGPDDLDKSTKKPRSDNRDQSNRSSKSLKSTRKTGKKTSQEKHAQLKELRRSVNKKLRSKTNDDPSVESPFDEKGKKTRKKDAEDIK